MGLARPRWLAVDDVVAPERVHADSHRDVACCSAGVPKGCLAIRARDELGPLFTDEQFAARGLPPSPSGHAQPAQPQPVSTTPQGRRTRAGVNRPDATTARPTVGSGEPGSVCPAWVGGQCEHGSAERQWQTPRRRRRTDGARLRRDPNLRRGPLHRSALPLQPRSALRDPPRMGPAEGNSAAAVEHITSRGDLNWHCCSGRKARAGGSLRSCRTTLFATCRWPG